MPDEERDKKKQSAEPQKSTTDEIQIYHSEAADEEDVFVLKIDAKHPARRQIMSSVQAALEGAGRNEEAVRVKAYAQERLPDDWRRKQPTSQEARQRGDSGEIRKK
jgi:hypothetical protein